MSRKYKTRKMRFIYFLKFLVINYEYCESSNRNNYISAPRKHQKKRPGSTTRRSSENANVAVDKKNVVFPEEDDK